jgi:hypothetical protein
VCAGVALAALVLVPAAAADTSPPAISYTITGTTGSNGWYRGSSYGPFVVVGWSVKDPDSPITASTGCEPGIRIYSPAVAATLTCTATSAGGTASVTTAKISVDAEPPTAVGPAPSRGPDYNGWYNHPLTVAWHGSDATSGIASCTSLSFPSAGLVAASLTGGCTDNAGNVAYAPFALQYDATAPTVRGVSVASRDGANTLSWTRSSPADTVVVERTARGSKKSRLVFRGAASSFTDKQVADGREYRYVVHTVDEAGNASKAVPVTALPKSLALGPASYVPRAAGAPVLHWSRVSKAAYYHVQLFRNGRRILAAWPLATKLALKTHWRWQGHRYRLSRGTYRWFVWAGFGPRSAARYRLLGRATFIAS